MNLAIVKTHSTADGGQGGVVDSGKGDLIAYQLTVANSGPDAATGVTVSDPLPQGVTYVAGSFTGPAGLDRLGRGRGADSHLLGTLASGDSAALHVQCDRRYARPVRSGRSVPRHRQPACVKSIEHDSDTSDNCSHDTTKVKAIAVSTQSLCVNDAPVVSYSLTPFNLTSAPTIALIWWTTDGYANHDPSIPAGDQAALLADGAQQVDYVALPAGWMNGQTISGTQLWPGASVDANGRGNGWPGWRQLSDGTWVLDPAAPFYNLRNDAIVEVRINPTSAATVAYPPASTHCTPTTSDDAADHAADHRVGDRDADRPRGHRQRPARADDRRPRADRLGGAFLIWMRRRRGEAS